MAALETDLQQRTLALKGREEHQAQVQQAEQRRLEGWARQIEDESFRLQALDRATQQQAEQLASNMGQLSGLRGDLQAVLNRLDATLFPEQKVEVQRGVDAGSLPGSG